MRSIRFIALGLVVSFAGADAGCNREALPPPTDASTEDASQPPDLALPTTTCSAVELAVGCTIGHCTITGSLGDQTSVVQLAEQAIPSERSADAVGPVLCAVTLPSLSTTPQLVLSVRSEGLPLPDDALFEYLPAAPARLVTSSSVTGQAVSALVAATGVFGIAHHVGPFATSQLVGVDVSASADRADFLRNVSAHTITSAFSDGTRFYVGNGRRLLVYNTLPKEPGQKPDIVLGQPSLDVDLGGVSGAGFGGSAVNDIWSDGTRLVANVGNRVLVWNHVPTVSYTPADLVLGQPDFNTDRPNNGGVSASSLATAWSLTSDGTRLVVGDRQNHRFLLWNQFPTLIDQPADVVIGQPSFIANAAGGGALPLYQPTGVLLVPGGAFFSSFFTYLMHVATLTNNAPFDFKPTAALDPNVSATSIHYPGNIAPIGTGMAVADAWGDRVAIYRQLPTAPTPMDIVLGQPDLVRAVHGPVDGASFDPENTGGPVGLGSGGGMLLVPDKTRLLVWDTPPTYNYEPASRVIGHAGFSTREAVVDYRGISTRTLASPVDVAQLGDKVAVADRGNNRVLLFDAAQLAAGNVAAQVVLGQPDGESYVPNLDQRTPNAARLSGPAGVALVGTRVIVADSENHRVLIWNTVPVQDGTPADLVLGQADFIAHRPNHGRGDTSPVDGFSDADSDGFFYPTGVASDGTHLYVSDRLNHRVLVWATFPTTNGQAADAVLGQADFTSNRANRGNGIYTPVPNGFDLPTGLTLDGTSLWVADTENNRVVRWDTVTTSPTPAVFVGQPDGATLTNANYYGLSSNVAGYALGQPTSATSVLRPRAVALAGGRLYVAESDSNRVHFFDAAQASPTPLGQLGQGSDTAATTNSGGIGATTLAGPQGLCSDGTRLFVADALNHRVVGYDVTTPPASGAAATLFVGQSSPVSNGFNQASTASRGVTSRPAGVATFNGSVYVSDTAHHRVLVYPSPTGAGTVPTRTLGQPDANLSLPNAGGPASARTFASPRGLYVDATHLVVADSDNNRVLIFDPTSASADAMLVLGQSDFTGVALNAGGASASSLNHPAGVFFDGTRLFVADTGNHRVLVWSNFPTANGQAADLVLGQAAMNAIVANQGLVAPRADTLFSPTAIAVPGGVVTVADSGNNRVLFFSAIATGASASGVLGQADLVSRGTISDPSDVAHLAGPVALAEDGDFLYVADRDLGRVLAYPLPLVGGSSAVRMLGAASGISISGPRGLAVARGDHFTSRLYVADTNDDRIVVIDSVSRFAP